MLIVHQPTHASRKSIVSVSVVCVCLCFYVCCMCRRAWFDEQLAVASKATSERGLYIGLRL